LPAAQPVRICYIQAMPDCALIDVPLLPYAKALSLLRGLNTARQSESIGETLVLTSHEPVITLGRRGEESDLLLPMERITGQGVAVERVERGGLVTAHGPGQLMVYPVMHLPSLGLGVAGMVACLERVGIAVCAELGVEAARREDHPGLWVGGRKIASIGLAVKHNVTLHGMALYNRPEPDLFALINPCGLASGQITSLAQELGQPIEDSKLRELMARCLADELDIVCSPWSLDQALETIRKHETASPKTALA
jgi:lipoyl(octanoyl) transferase